MCAGNVADELQLTRRALNGACGAVGTVGQKCVERIEFVNMKKLAFGGLKAVAVGALVSGATLAMGSVVGCSDNGGGVKQSDKKCGGDKKCSGQATCPAGHKCSADKKCGGEKKCSGDKKCSGSQK